MLNPTTPHGKQHRRCSVSNSQVCAICLLLLAFAICLGTVVSLDVSGEPDEDPSLFAPASVNTSEDSPDASLA